MLHQSIETSRRLGAVVWARHGETALHAVEERLGAATPDDANDPEPASLIRQGGVWAISWRQESGTLPHLKGLADIATLVGRRDQF